MEYLKLDINIAKNIIFFVEEKREIGYVQK